MAAIVATRIWSKGELKEKASSVIVEKRTGAQPQIRKFKPIIPVATRCQGFKQHGYRMGYFSIECLAIGLDRVCQRINPLSGKSG